MAPKIVYPITTVDCFHKNAAFVRLKITSPTLRGNRRKDFDTDSSIAAPANASNDVACGKDAYRHPSRHCDTAQCL